MARTTQTHGESEEADSPEPAKRRRVESIAEKAKSLIGRLGLSKYDGSRHKIENMIRDIEGEAPMEDNPDFKGEWFVKRISNPAYWEILDER